MKRNIFICCLFVFFAIFICDVFSQTSQNLQNNNDVELKDLQDADLYAKNKEYKKACDLYTSIILSGKKELRDYVITRLAVASLYRAKEEKSAAAAEVILSDVISSYGKKLTPELTNTYYQNLANYCAIQKKWGDCRKYAVLVNPKTQNSIYYLALADYSEGKISSAEKRLEKNYSNSDESSLLYAQICLGKNDFNKAIEIFSYLEEKQSDVFQNPQKVEYAKALLYEGKNNGAFEKASVCSGDEAMYIAAIASFNLKNWTLSEEYFSKMKSKDGSSEFYLGVAQYNLGKYNLSYATLMSFASKDSGTGSKRFNAYLMASDAALQSGRLIDALTAALEAKKTGGSDDNVQKAVELCANLYVDNGNTQEALNLLKPYTSQRNAFGLRAKYLSAQIYIKEQNVDGAISIYNEIVNEYGKQSQAENAAFARGELYFQKKKYVEAIKAYDYYLSNYKNNSDSAMYYSYQCSWMLKNFNDAILKCEMFIQSYPESLYFINAKKDLIEIYKSAGEYKSALQAAEGALTVVDSSEKSRLEKEIAELKKLSSSSDKEIAQKEIEYENAGGIKTLGGRIAGTELAQMYFASYSLQEKGAALATVILKEQEKNIDAENQYAAVNAKIVATSYRQKGKNKDSAFMFIKAASYFKMCNNEENAAQSLYGAVEAFDAAGMYNDSKAVAKELEKEYPESRQNAEAKRIISR